MTSISAPFMNGLPFPLPHELPMPHQTFPFQDSGIRGVADEELKLESFYIGTIQDDGPRAVRAMAYVAFKISGQGWFQSRDFDMTASLYRDYNINDRPGVEYDVSGRNVWNIFPGSSIIEFTYPDFEKEFSTREKARQYVIDWNGPNNQVNRIVGSATLSKGSEKKTFEFDQTFEIP